MINHKEEIIHQLEKIIEKSTIINQYKDQIPQLEIDLILSDIRDLYEMYYHLNQNTTNNEIFLNANRRKEIEIAAKFNKENINNVKVEPFKIFEEEEKNTHIEPQIANEIELNTSNLAFNTNQIVAEKFKDEANSINDKIGLTKTDNSIASKINEHQLSDIRKGIGINEKFLFLKELFNNNAEQYEVFINKINSLSEQAETKEWLVTQKKQFQWDEKSEAYIAINKLIERKFV